MLLRESKKTFIPWSFSYIFEQLRILQQIFNIMPPITNPWYIGKMCVYIIQQLIR